MKVWYKVQEKKILKTTSFAMDTVPRIWSKVLFENNPSKRIDCFLLAENPKLGLPLIYVTFKSLVLLSYSTIFQAKQLILVFLKKTF